MATILPVPPRLPRPVGIEINNVPTVDSDIISFSPKLITIGKVTIPASKPTTVSNPIIVSEVQGKLGGDKDVWDLLKATFPAGTVTGAPKIRAMQLIQTFEKESRGPYAGIYGSVDINGALNTAITIRSMVAIPIQDGKISVYVQAGAGVVADSSPLNEYNETVNKAKGILMAISSLN